MPMLVNREAYAIHIGNVMLIPTVPMLVQDRHMENPHVKRLLEIGSLRMASGDDKPAEKKPDEKIEPKIQPTKPIEKPASPPPPVTERAPEHKK